LLVATNTAEEGIDVADCEFVIRFNRFDTTKSHIQGSGRARREGSIIYYFENDGKLEQEQADKLAEVARDETLALSDEARASHHESVAQRSAASSPFYPFCPDGEAQVNLGNAGKILTQYSTTTMRQMISPKDLCEFVEEETQSSPQQRRKTICSVRYPTPEGWRQVVKDKNDKNLMQLFLACEREVALHQRYKNLSNAEKDIRCFFYVAVVQLRRQGLLDKTNMASEDARCYTALRCSALCSESTLNIRPKFKGVPDHGGEEDASLTGSTGARGGSSARGVGTDRDESDDESYVAWKTFTEDESDDEGAIYIDLECRGRVEQIRV